jgi:ATP-dependent Lhr-like helicase
VNEDFAIESIAGDVFLLGNQSWRIRRVASGKVRVEDAQGAPPTIPFWFGEAPSRTMELSVAVSDLREEVAQRVSKNKDGQDAADWLTAETGLDAAGAEQVIAYLRDTLKVLGTVPTRDRIVAERFFDEAGGMQLVLHTPFGGRINRAWGLALRKRFCLRFDFELQAAATDDGLVLSLSEQHSFPLESIFAYVHPNTLREDLIQAALQSPMFTNRWRWNATRALAVLRHMGGRRVPIAIQRMRAEDLLGAVFPDQVGCQDNRMGNIDPPDHPLVNETVDNCLHEAMDIDGLREILEKINNGDLRTVAVETPAPSPISHEILNANPYAFLDDAPLEERRARAVSLRRVLPDLEDGVAALDPEAIAEVCAQAWPDVRDADELHDALLTLILLPEAEAGPWHEFMKELRSAGRAALAHWNGPDGGEHRGYVAAERFSLARQAFPGLGSTEEIREPPPLGPQDADPDEEKAVRLIVQGWMECTGPITVKNLADRLGLPEVDVKIAMAGLEGQGSVLQGRFTAGLSEGVQEWCDRRLLARIHQLTLGRLRREIEPVSASNFMRFLFRWQHVQPGSRFHGRDGLLEVIRQLQGLELPAPAWEQSVFRNRIENYDPDDLESLCLAGMTAWGRLKLAPPVSDSGETNGNRRPRPASPSRQAPLGFVLREDLPEILEAGPPAENSLHTLSSAGQDVYRFLEEKGASFLGDIAKETGHLKTAVEEALWELVANGLATGDGIAGLRALLMKDVDRKTQKRRFRSLQGKRAAARFMPAGRWSLWRPKGQNALSKEERLEVYCRQFLRRYGVVFRELLIRETCTAPWRELLSMYRRLEARGEIRGGRFVEGFIGEQFALQEAVEGLRAVRRNQEEEETIIVAASDPLNLVGIITPGARVSQLSLQVIAYRNGNPVHIGPLGEVRSRMVNSEKISEEKLVSA